MNQSDDEALLRNFEAAAIPAEAWRHETHLRVAFLYLSKHPFDEAISRIRDGIQALNRANGVEDALTAGYHETMTLAWGRVIRAAIDRDAPEESASTFLARNPSLQDKLLMRRYYSPDRIVTREAKVGWVEPDLQALPDFPDDAR